MRSISTFAIAVGAAALALGASGATAQNQPTGQQGGGPAVQPPAHETGATKDMNRAVPPMTPDAKAETGAPGGWTSDEKLRETRQKGAVEKSAKQKQKSGSAAQ